MTRAALLLLASCTLDPQGVLDDAVLRVDLYGAEGNTARLRVSDSKGATVEKKAAVHGDPMEMVFEQHTLADGSVLIDAELFDASDALIGCATRTGTAGAMTDPVLVGFSSPSVDQLNCGTCGNRCDAANATPACVMGACQYTCNSGFVAADAGCVRPVPMADGGSPDAGAPDGGLPDAGTVDAGSDDGGQAPDAGPVCMPSAEGSPAACSDGVDNNCDLRVDCADPGCNGLERACTTTCSTPGTQTWDCATRTWSPCAGDPSAENSMAACSDGIDNDCDGKTDCADEGCQHLQVACPGGICAGGVKLWNCTTHLLGLCLPYIPLPEAPLLCGDGLDNNCDGQTDCADSTCTGKSCGVGKVCCPDHTCRSGC